MSSTKDASKAQQERVQSLLIDTVTLLCKNSIQFQDELKVEGLLGITVDKEVFLVNINEKFSEEKEESEPEDEPIPAPQQSPRGSKRPHDNSTSAGPSSSISVKQEIPDDDDEDLVIIKDENVRMHPQERRVPPLHGTSDDFAQGDFGAYSQQYGQRDGEPPTKRRSMPGSFQSGDSSHSSDSMMGQFNVDPNIPNLSSQLEGGDGDNMAWLAQQQATPGGSQNMEGVQRYWLCERRTCLSKQMVFATESLLIAHVRKEHYKPNQVLYQCRCGAIMAEKTVCRHLRLTHKAKGMIGKPTMEKYMTELKEGDIR